MGRQNSKGKLLLASTLIFGRNVVLGNFFRRNLAFVGVGSVFDAVHNARFERLPLFDKLRDAFGVHVFNTGQPLKVAGLAACLQSDTLTDSSARSRALTTTAGRFLWARGFLPLGGLRLGGLCRYGFFLALCLLASHGKSLPPVRHVDNTSSAKAERPARY
jgi:hypothetical protein